jgi:hypothetical protein
MQLPIIRQLGEKYSLAELKAAENQIMNGQPCPIPNSGKDEGEQLTHLLAAIWVKEEMEKENIDAGTALRRYTQRVRNSIT